LETRTPQRDTLESPSSAKNRVHDEHKPVTGATSIGTISELLLPVCKDYRQLLLPDGISIESSSDRSATSAIAPQ
jgi:hypothetical protein